MECEVYERKSDIINNKVNSIKKLGWIREVGYPTWLSNVVLANKTRGSHRICMDFTNINLDTPKD